MNFETITDMEAKASAWQFSFKFLICIQIDLGPKLRLITAVASQGSHNYDEWVTSYKLSYSTDGGKWKVFGKGDIPEVRTVITVLQCEFTSFPCGKRHNLHSKGLPLSPLRQQPGCSSSCAYAESLRIWEISKKINRGQDSCMDFLSILT